MPLNLFSELPVQAYKLNGMGVIKQLGEQAIAGCELYRRYFTNKQEQHFLYTKATL
ncbi:MAG: AAA-like domain-containing protein [Xenococcaceae cyanobacterium MO_207.B15]|nr:AAA-like domain-containing protein [Xenococcaceae cyanobacterium MO_207.B15]MDJ0743088.1 AAA-like domain-containing protein [Xenococcaceae cyanobacterium MO_167.B27]